MYTVRRGGTSQLYLRSLQELEPTPIPGTEDGTAPFTSPDGEWLGFFAEGKLKVVPFTGGRATAIADGPSPRGASWGPDGKIVFAPLTVGGLSTVSTTGGSIETLITLDPERDEKKPSLAELPSGWKGAPLYQLDRWPLQRRSFFPG